MYALMELDKISFNYMRKLGKDYQGSIEEKKSLVNNSHSGTANMIYLNSKKLIFLLKLL